MKKIHTRAELVALAQQLKVRPDWHEPDEQDLTVEVHGNIFDNAGFWPFEQAAMGEVLEYFVYLKQGERRIAAVNLATLFAWASQSDPCDKES